MEYKIGIDVGGTNIRGILKSGRKSVGKIKMKTENISRQIIEIMDYFLDNFKIDKKNIKKIGIGLPGIIDKKENIKKLPNIENFKGEGLKNFLEKKYKCEVKISNDGKCFALAELKFGQGKKVKNFVCLTIGTGIGGGIIINKKLYEGINSEFGHLTIEERGRKCSCGNRGCLEEYISKKGIINNARKARIPGDIFEIIKEVKKGNKKDEKVIKESGVHLGKGLSLIIKILNPELIIIGGGISRFGEKILKPAREEAQRRTLFKICKIKKSLLNEYSGAEGAIELE